MSKLLNEENLPALLEQTIKEAGLQLDESEKIKQSYLPYFEEIGLIKEESTRINWEKPTLTDEKIARDLRLRMVKVRTGSENIKDERKKIHSLKANLEQSTWNLIKSTSLLMEAEFGALEKRREIEEKARLEALRIERIALLEPYKEFVSFEHLDLSAMAESNFLNILNGAKLSLKAKEQQEKKDEEERIKKEKAEAAEAVERERIRIENEKLKAEAAKKEKELELERAKVEKEKQALIEAANKAKLASEAKLKAEKEENEKLQAAIQAKKEAEEKAKKEAEDKLAAEKLAEKKAKAAPDKEKLLLLADAILNTLMPSVTSEEAINIVNNVKILLKKTSDFIKEKTNGI